MAARIRVSGIGAIAHDLRTPLFTLRAYLDGLGDGLATSPQKAGRYLQVCRSSANALDRLGTDLFTYPPMEAPHAPGAEPAPHTNQHPPATSPRPAPASPYASRPETRFRRSTASRRDQRRGSRAGAGDGACLAGYAGHMADNIYSVSEIVGSSTESVDDAIRGAVSRAAETLHNPDWFEVTDPRGPVQGDGPCP